MRKPVRIAIALTVLCAGVSRGADPMIVKKSTKLDKNAVIAGPLVIEADGITIDGNGATIQGPGKAGDLKSFTGNGITGEKRSRITLRNLKVRGFESGLVGRDGRDWVIENCDFSDNYHDPSYGWGDYKRVGGIILTGMSGCTIRNSKANRVWNGLDLWESSNNRIEKNDFSHCSNVCLKMWLACGNTVLENNLSYGLRISPGEVHARDSTSVLIETGSDNNRFEKNDITHGGDGVFIRPLNGWCSAGNVFVENDCSYANNNGFESWSPGNTYIRNKANHCSYGFWLGGSDHTVLIDNEAGWNGRPDGFHNAPEADFHHGGIVIVGGSGTHTVIEGNYCHDNAGGGIVFRGDVGSKGAKWKMYHLIVQNNRLENNRWGLFARFTDWLDLAGNTFKGNEKEEFLEEVTNISRRPADPEKKPAPKVEMMGPGRAEVGREVTFDGSASRDAAGRPLTFRWDVGGTEYKTPSVRHTFSRPGFYRVGVTATNGYLAGMAFRDVYVTQPPVKAVAGRPAGDAATENRPGAWGWTMGDNGDHAGKVIIAADKDALVGKESLRLRPDPYKGSDVTFVYPGSRDAGWNLADAHWLSFWVRFRNPNMGGFQGPNPIVRLHRGKSAFTYTPAFGGMPRNLLGDLPYSEARHGWLYVRIPLEGGDEWLRSETVEGARPPHLDHGLKFTTVLTPAETQSASSMTSDGQRLYCATHDGDGLFATEDGKTWSELASPNSLGGGGDWINGMLVYDPGQGGKGRLLFRRRAEEKDAFNHDQARLVIYDIESNKWSWTPTVLTMGHGAVVVDGHLFGLAHAIGGNYGGPVCRVDLAHPGALDDHTVLHPVKGKDAWWFSRAAQLAFADGRIFAIKNDWQTPQPAKTDEIGDRLLAFNPKEYKSSSFAGGDRWDSPKWKEARTPVEDLGPLPFEIGHGGSLVALPPDWCSLVGRQGGLFIVAGCSPSNHEGYGAASARYAIYDIASAKFTVGVLPDITATGTSAALHRGRLYIKRGGMNYGPSNRELWIVEPVPADQIQAAGSQARRDRMDLKRVEALSFQLDSMGNDPFDIWLDGLQFE